MKRESKKWWILVLLIACAWGSIDVYFSEETNQMVSVLQENVPLIKQDGEEYFFCVTTSKVPQSWSNTNVSLFLHFDNPIPSEVAISWGPDYIYKTPVETNSMPFVEVILVSNGISVENWNFTHLELGSFSCSVISPSPLFDLAFFMVSTSFYDITPGSCGTIEETEVPYPYYDSVSSIYEEQIFSASKDSSSSSHSSDDSNIGESPTSSSTSDSPYTISIDFETIPLLESISTSDDTSTILKSITSAFGLMIAFSILIAVLCFLFKLGRTKDPVVHYSQPVFVQQQQIDDNINNNLQENISNEPVNSFCSLEPEELSTPLRYALGLRLSDFLHLFFHNRESQHVHSFDDSSNSSELTVIPTTE